MASLEYYLEALRERRPGREDILEITRNSLEALSYWPIPAEEGDSVGSQQSTDVLTFSAVATESMSPDEALPELTVVEDGTVTFQEAVSEFLTLVEPESADIFDASLREPVQPIVTDLYEGDRRSELPTESMPDDEPVIQSMPTVVAPLSSGGFRR